MTIPSFLLARTVNLSQAGTLLASSAELTAVEAIGLSLIGISVVFVVLSLIALAIGTLPKLLETFDPWIPRLHGETPADSPPNPAEALPARERRIVAAIGYVLHQEMMKARNDQDASTV